MPRRHPFLPALGAAVALLLAALAPASASAAAPKPLGLDGHGFGHGVGLSQYGAYGYAKRAGKDFRFILGHYYPGTELAQAKVTRPRVLLSTGRSQDVCGATRVSDARHRVVRLSSSRTYRASANGRSRIRLYDLRRRRTKARMTAPLRITGGSSTCLRGTAINGVRNGFYRGAMLLDRSGSTISAVNKVHIRHYLYGVISAEMPSSWPAEAQRSQAVAARTYAMGSLRPRSSFDVYPDTRSQVYRGIAGETATAKAAARDTDNLAVYYKGALARTFFSSTSGGRTEAVQDAFGGAPVPYLVSVDDPYDDISPVHDWKTRFTGAQADSRLRSVLRGHFQKLQVATRTASGRAATVKVVGDKGSRTVSAATIRSLLGLRSTWFDVA